MQGEIHKAIFASNNDSELPKAKISSTTWEDSLFRLVIVVLFRYKLLLYNLYHVCNVLEDASIAENTVQVVSNFFII